MSGLEAWIIIAVLFAVPGYLLWRWRGDDTRSQARRDERQKLSDALNPLVREIKGPGAGPWWNRRP